MPFLKRFHTGLTDFKKGFRQGFTAIINPVVRGVRVVTQVGHHLDTLLNAAKNIPIVGEIAAEIQDSPEYKGFSNVLNSGSSLVDRGVRLGGLIDRGADKFIGSIGRLEGSETGKSIDNTVMEGQQVVRDIRSGLGTARSKFSTLPMMTRLFG